MSNQLIDYSVNVRKRLATSYNPSISTLDQVTDQQVAELLDSHLVLPNEALSLLQDGCTFQTCQRLLDVGVDATDLLVSLPRYPSNADQTKFLIFILDAGAEPAVIMEFITAKNLSPELFIKFSDKAPDLLMPLINKIPYESIVFTYAEVIAKHCSRNDFIDRITIKTDVLGIWHRATDIWDDIQQQLFKQSAS